MRSNTPVPFVATHTLLAGWGYDHQRNGVASFDRATQDTPVRIAPTENARPGYAIVYTASGERRHIVKRALSPLGGAS